MKKCVLCAWLVGGFFECFLHFGQIADHRLVAKLDDILLVGVGDTFESCATLG